MFSCSLIVRKELPRSSRSSPCRPLRSYWIKTLGSSGWKRTRPHSTQSSSVMTPM
jgi:hypothetical protein